MSWAPKIIRQSDGERRFLLMTQADDIRARKAITLRGNLWCMKNEKAIKPRLHRMASVNLDDLLTLIDAVSAIFHQVDSFSHKKKNQTQWDEQQKPSRSEA